MRGSTSPWILAGLSAAGFGAVVAVGASGGAVVLIILLALLMFGGIGWTMRTRADSAWLPTWVLVGFAAKLIGAFARHWMVSDLYDGVGDSVGYYRVGIELADRWHTGQIPGLTGNGSFGTQVVEWITGAIFAVFTPDFLGGFIMFAILCFFGQLMLYAAFRRWAQPHQLKPYAAMLFLLPTYMFWPSSIGKDALVVMALGGAAYFAARTLEAFAMRWIPGLILFVTLLGIIRIHVAGLVVAGLVIAGILARLPDGIDPIARVRRLVFVGVAVGAAAVVLAVFPEIFGVGLAGDAGLDEFTSDVVRRTSESGTIAAGDAVDGPADVPGAIALVLFRPFPWEATELQHYFAALETGLVLLLTVWKLPAMLRNWRAWRGNGYVVFCTFYVLGFAIAFSVVRNLGIIARQRGQVLAFFLCIVVALGWEMKATVRPQIPAVLPVDRGKSEVVSAPVTLDAEEAI